MRHLLGLRDLGREEVERLLDNSQRFAGGGGWVLPGLRGMVMATLFYEPSTRTELSFELAAKRLGAEVLRCNVDRSSVQKGESLVDTARTLEALGADVLVIRHPSAGGPALAARHVGCAVINAGDGMHEHPTQGLVDLLTIRQVKGGIEGLRVAIVGDVAHSRVARSAAWGLTACGAEVVFCGPRTLLPDCLSDIAPITMTTSLDEALDGADVVIALRVQVERRASGDVPSLGEYARLYGITPAVLSRARPDAILMHPGPANLGVEISAEAAYGPQSVITRQVTNAVPVRMAVLQWVLEQPIIDRRSSIVDEKPAVVFDDRRSTIDDRPVPVQAGVE